MTPLSTISKRQDGVWYFDYGEQPLEEDQSIEFLQPFSKEDKIRALCALEWDIPRRLEFGKVEL